MYSLIFGSSFWSLKYETQMDKELWTVCGAIAPLLLRLRHYMKVQGQHQAPSHFNSAHTENLIVNVAVIILNEVCVIYDLII